MEPRLRNMLAQPKSTITLAPPDGRRRDRRLQSLQRRSRRKHRASARRAAHHRDRASRAVPRRRPAAERRVFHLYADEFQSFATESFALILVRGAQVRPHPDASPISISTSSPTSCARPCSAMPDRSSPAASGAEDAAILAEQIGLDNPDALLDLPTFPPGRGCCAAAPRPRRSACTSTTRRVSAGRTRTG